MNVPGTNGPQELERPDEPATRAELHYFVNRAAEVIQTQDAQITTLNENMMRANQMMKTMNDSILKLAQDNEILRQTLEGMFTERKH